MIHEVSKNTFCKEIGIHHQPSNKAGGDGLCNVNYHLVIDTCVNNDFWKGVFSSQELGEVGSEDTRDLWFAKIARKDPKRYPKRGR